MRFSGSSEESGQVMRRLDYHPTFLFPPQPDELSTHHLLSYRGYLEDKTC
jgi:hypothetical protein